MNSLDKLHQDSLRRYQDWLGKRRQQDRTQDGFIKEKTRRRSRDGHFPVRRQLLPVSQPGTAGSIVTNGQA